MSNAANLPEGYRPHLDTRQVEAATKDIKDFFEVHLARGLNLRRVTAPPFVRSGEVACGIWPQEMQEECEKANVMLL